MDLIDTNDGWFVTRLKPNANPLITEELRDWRGYVISLTGKQCTLSSTTYTET